MADLGSILRESRQTAHLSQETAAVQSFCDVSTIRRYENGSILPSWDTICMLSDVYGDPGLKYRAQQEMEAWQDTFPHVEFVPLPISALHLISATREMSDNADMLAEILADGKIGADELEEWEQVLHSVKEQIVACTQVLEAGADGK